MVMLSLIKGLGDEEGMVIKREIVRDINKGVEEERIM